VNRLSHLVIVSILVSFGMFGCETTPSSTTNSNNSQSKQIQTQATHNEKTQSIELQLLKELDSFKSSSSFKTHGFGQGGRHYSWLSKVQEAKSTKGIGIKTKISLGELEALGQEYQRTGGQETDSTRWFRKRVLDPFGDD